MADETKPLFLHIQNGQLHLTRSGLRDVAVAHAGIRGCRQLAQWLLDNGRTLADVLYSSSVDFPREYGARNLAYRELLSEAWHKLNGGTPIPVPQDVPPPVHICAEHMPGKLYVLSSVSWQYNDEYNYRPEEGPVHPKGVYTNKEEAERLCAALNQQEWCRCNPFEFVSHEQDYDDVVDLAWPAWRDWLLENDITPPGEEQEDGTADPALDEPPEVYFMSEWWNTHNQHWDSKSGAMVKGDWTQAQLMAVAKHIGVAMWEVTEVECDMALEKVMQK